MHPTMQLSLKSTTPDKQQKSALIVGIYADGTLPPAAKTLDIASKGFISKLIKQGAFEGKTGLTLPLFHLPNTSFEQILLIGCGSENSLNPAGYRKIITAAIKGLATGKLTQAVSFLTELNVADKSLAWKVKHHAEVIGESIYSFDMFKTEKDPVSTVKELIIHLPDSKQQKACEIALKQGQAIANGVTLTKNLANLPSNICISLALPT